MQVFCDESGGIDPANHTFLVAAVAISSASATRLLKTFRKAVNWPGTEIKGHALKPEQRRIFFDLLAREAHVGSIVVSCHRHEAVGGWAMSSLPEITLYRRLLSEACEEVAASGVEALTIVIDGGRYKRVDLRRVEDDLVGSAGTWTIGRRRTTVSFRNSASVPGLQIADVIANTAFQSLGRTPAAVYAEEILRPLRLSDNLILRPIVLADCRPTWLTSGQTQKPPKGGFC